MSFKGNCDLKLFIMLPYVLLPLKLGTSLRLVLRTPECETLLKTPEQVNKTYKQQVCALIIAPLALGAYSTTCWTNVLVNIHSQYVRAAGTTYCKELHRQIQYFLLIWKGNVVVGLNVVQGSDHSYRASTAECFTQGHKYQWGIMWALLDTAHLNLTTFRPTKTQ